MTNRERDAAARMLSDAATLLRDAPRRAATYAMKFPLQERGSNEFAYLVQQTKETANMITIIVDEYLIGRGRR